MSADGSKAASSAEQERPVACSGGTKGILSLCDCARKRRMFVAFLVLFVQLFGAFCVVGQQPLPSPLNRGRVGPFGGDEPAPDPMVVQKQRHAMNVQRQKEMVSDAGKLLQLAQKLEVEIGKSQSGSLTAEQVRTIDRIEKLARSVREKMGYCVACGPRVMTPMSMHGP